MAEEVIYLNFRISEKLNECLIDAAKQSGWDKSKQARRMLEAAFGIEPRQPYIPIPGASSAPFRSPIHEPRGKKGRRRRNPVTA